MLPGHSVESRNAYSPERNPNVFRGQAVAAGLSLSAVIGAIAVGVPALAPADGGCPNDLVPRNARPGDQVCVTKQVAAEIAQENANAANLREPNGGAYGPQTCKSGYVWREAFDGDAVCVLPQRRQETWNENAGAGHGPTGGNPYGTRPPDVTHPNVPVVPLGPSQPVGTPPLPTPGAPPPGSPGQSHPPAPGATTPNAPPNNGTTPRPTNDVTTPLPSPTATTTQPPSTTTKKPACDPKVDVCVN